MQQLTEESEPGSESVRAVISSHSDQENGEQIPFTEDTDKHPSEESDTRRSKSRRSCDVPQARGITPSPTRLHKSHMVLSSTHISNDSCLQKLEATMFPGVPPEYSFRRKLNVWLYKTKRGVRYDAVITALSLVACGSYVAQTYLLDDPEYVYLDSHLYPIDVALTSAFTFDYFLRWFAAKRRLRYPLKGSAIVDLLTIVPVWVDVAIQGDSKVELLFLRFTRILRVLRIYKVLNLSRVNSSAISRESSRLFLIIICLLVVFSGIFHLVEGQLIQEISGVTREDFDEEPITFGMALYFLIVTTTTVGYGDLTPVTDAGRLVISLMIMTSFVLIPMQVNRLSELYSSRSRYRTKVQRGDAQHVLVTGAVHDVPLLRAFIHEFLHPDRYVGLDIRARDGRIVIVAPDEPSEELVDLLLSPSLQERVLYVKASVVSDADLHRIAADEAEACFVLAARTPKRAELQDYQIILRTLMLENFNPRLRTFVQLHKSDSVEFLSQSASNQLQVVHCIERLRLRVLAMSTMYPGTNTLVYNLLTSYSPHFNQSPAVQAVWMKEYRFGLGFEVYTVGLPALFVGCSFGRLVLEVYLATKGLVQVVGLSMNPGATSRMRDKRRRRTRHGAQKKGDTLQGSLREFSSQGIPHHGSDEGHQSGSHRPFTRVAPGNAYIVQANTSVVVLAQSLSMATQLMEPEFALAIQAVRQSGAEGIGDNRLESVVAMNGEESNFTPQHHDATDGETSVNSTGNGDDVYNIVVEDNWNSVDVSEGSVHGGAQVPNSPLLQRMSRLGSVGSDLSNKEGKRFVIRRFTPSRQDASHVVCVTPVLDGLMNFAYSLRLMALGDPQLVKTLIVVCPTSTLDTQSELMADLGALGKVYFVLGDIRSAHTLARAGVKTAMCVTILSNDTEIKNVDGEIVDGHAIFSHMAVAKWRHQHLATGAQPPTRLRTLVECHTTSNIYILERRRDWETRQTQRALSALDVSVESQSSVASSFIKRHLPYSHSSLSNSESGSSTEPKEPADDHSVHLHADDLAARANEGYRVLPIFASGEAASREEFSTLLCQAYYQPSIVQVVEQLLPEGARTQVDPVTGDSGPCGVVGESAFGRLIQVNLPRKYKGSTFGSLHLELLCRHQCLAIGLYRTPTGVNQAPVSYVFTCPPRETLICQGDRLMVVGDAKNLRNILASGL